MITVITGTPGAGKTALAVDLLSREYADRPLFVDNLDGLLLEHQEIDVMNWHNDVPDGGLIVSDEIQRKWRPRGPGTKVPDCISALETHRHRGIDFILITQNVKLIDANVRALVGRHLHIRDTGWMGRWLYEFSECDTNNSWKRCENKRRYKLPKHVFDKYKSASLHTKPVRNRPMLLYVLAAAFLAFLYVAFTLYSSFKSAPTAPTDQTTATASALVPQSSSIAQGLASSALGISPSGSTQQSALDDRVDWIPRVPTMPESAPAFDGVRKVQQFPVVAGGVCFKGECKCFTQQGTNVGLSHADCLTAINNPRFDAYSAPAPVQQAQSKTAPPVDQATANSPEIKHAVAVENHTAQQAVTRAARTEQLVSKGSL